MFGDDEGRLSPVAPLILFHKPGEEREDDMLDDNIPVLDRGDWDSEDGMLDDPGIPSDPDGRAPGTGTGLGGDDGPIGKVSGDICSSPSLFMLPTYGLSGTGDDIELPLPCASGGSWSEGEEDDDSGSPSSKTSASSRHDVALDHSFCSSSISKTVSSGSEELCSNNI